MQDEPKFFSEHAETRRHTNRLPHWQQDGATYVVTYRLADSVPAHLLEQWQDEREIWLKFNPPPWSQKQEDEYCARFSASMERWLDESHGECLLRDPAAAGCAARVLRNFDGARYTQHAWVVMPNHVHALFSLHSGETLDATLKSWKGVSSREINKLFNRDGTLWMKDYFDRLIRDAGHFWNSARYIRNNPLTARLRPGEFLHYQSPQVKSGLDDPWT